MTRSIFPNGNITHTENSTNDEFYIDWGPNTLGDISIALRLYVKILWRRSYLTPATEHESIEMWSARVSAVPRERVIIP